jgi:hypothetical protein
MAAASSSTPIVGVARLPSAGPLGCLQIDLPSRTSVKAVIGEAGCAMMGMRAELRLIHV